MPPPTKATDFDDDVCGSFPHSAALFSDFAVVVNQKVSQKTLPGSRITDKGFTGEASAGLKRIKSRNCLTCASGAVQRLHQADERGHLSEIVGLVAMARMERGQSCPQRSFAGRIARATTLHSPHIQSDCSRKMVWHIH